MSRPMVAVNWPERSVLANRLRRTPRSSEAVSTRSTSDCWTWGALLMTRDTVFRLTPARRATSTMVGRRLVTSRLTGQRYQGSTGEIPQQAGDPAGATRASGVDLEFVDARRVVGRLRGSCHIQAHIAGVCRGDRMVRHARRVGGDRGDGGPGRAIPGHLDVEVAGVPRRGLATGPGVLDRERLDGERRAPVNLEELGGAQ